MKRELISERITIALTGIRNGMNQTKFDKLITLLRTAVDNDGNLDKESTSYNDIFDA